MAYNLQTKLEGQMERLREIGVLRGYEFSVPHYQRGYRWGEREVGELLEDVWDFAREGEGAEDFYCLQPVVTKKIGGQKYLLIDGQQRLTTIFLIMKFLKNEDFFDIEYETRPESAGFLREIESKTEGRNIDFWHFLKAHETIQKFFRDDRIDRARFEMTLLEHCKVLWYELDKNESDEDVFIRLNMGKIPLKEAENIKAMFLSKQNGLDEGELKDRAEFWYESEIEARENRDFRYCVLSQINDCDISYYQDRITKHKKLVLSDDVVRLECYLKAITPIKTQNNLLADFYDIYKHDKNKFTEKWRAFKAAAEQLSSFASEGRDKLDREIFHYLGFLTYSGENIYTIYEKWRKLQNKPAFRDWLFNSIKARIQDKISALESLVYGNDRKELCEILLLFNLQYLINNEGSDDYFKFHRFKLERWSLEHIYAQNSKSISSAIKGRETSVVKEWLEEVKQYISKDETTEDNELARDIEKAIKDIEHRLQDKQSLHNDLLDRIDEAFKNNQCMHTIGNLTLLDFESNAKIGNEIFSKKLKLIRKLDEESKLIPIATRKVFEKEFSNDKSNPNVFSDTDQQDYLNAIKKILCVFERGKNG